MYPKSIPDLTPRGLDLNTKMPKLQPLAHLNTNRQLFATGTYSDLVLCCGERKFYVHRAILCTKSSFFAKACEGNFSVRFQYFFAKACEGNFRVRFQYRLYFRLNVLILIALQEAVSRTVNLVGDDPDTVVRMLSHLYALEYDDVGSHVIGLENPVPLLSKTNSKFIKYPELVVDIKNIIPFY